MQTPGREPSTQLGAGQFHLSLVCVLVPGPGSHGELGSGSEWESRSGVFQEEGTEERLLLQAVLLSPSPSESWALSVPAPSMVLTSRAAAGGPGEGPRFPLSCALAPASHLLLCFFPVGRPVASRVWGTHGVTAALSVPCDALCSRSVGVVPPLVESRASFPGRPGARGRALVLSRGLSPSV